MNSLICNIWFANNNRKPLLLGCIEKIISNSDIVTVLKIISRYIGGLSDISTNIILVLFNMRYI